MSMAITTTSRASSPTTLKNISTMALVLRAAAVASSFLPLSSSSAVSSLVSLTCHKTAHERLCNSVLASDKRSAAAESVQQLAVIALTAARNSTRDALWRATALLGSSGGASSSPTPLERGRLARCRALYAECLRETTRTVALVTAARYGGAARAASTLHWYPEKCQSLLYLQSSESAMEKTNRRVEEMLIASADIVHLLHDASTGRRGRGADKLVLDKL